MSRSELLFVMVAAGLGAGTAAVAARYLWRHVSEQLIRVNVSGKAVPAVLGLPVAAAGLLTAGLYVAMTGTVSGRGSMRVGIAVASAIAIMAGAGWWDDLRGSEAPRGFSGHLQAARGGRLTGGLVKLLAGGTAGALAGLLLGRGLAVTRIALLVALTANLINLFDRAPGRAGKMSFSIGLPLLAFGHPAWAISSAGTFGALAWSLPFDLRERAMLGDAGANAIGAVLGIGLAISLPYGPAWVAIVLLLGFNLLSERVSFSRVIEGNRLLRWFDGLGRGE